MIMRYGLAGSLILSGVLGLLLLNARADLSQAKEVIRSLEGWQGQMVSSIGLASGNKDVTKDTAQAQVQALGNSLVDLKLAIQTSNHAVERMAEQKRQAEIAADRERAFRSAAIVSASRTRDELNGRSEKPASIQFHEEEIRLAQDAAYEAGL